MQEEGTGVLRDGRPCFNTDSVFPETLKPKPLHFFQPLAQKQNIGLSRPNSSMLRFLWGLGLRIAHWFLIGNKGIRHLKESRTGYFKQGDIRYHIPSLPAVNH